MNEFIIEENYFATSKDLKKWWAEALKPDPILTVSEWADNYRILSRKAASEPGPYRTDRTPYLREVMDVLSAHHPAKKIVFMKGAQVGATECMNNWIGYIIDYCPAPMMMVLPRMEDARRNSKLRIAPLIEESPRLREKVRAAKSRDSSNTLLQKEFDGGALVMAGANSAAGLRSMPARFLGLDELDAYPHDVDGEGDPVNLAMARSRTFSRRKAFLVSTPTISGASKIESEFELSDQRYFYVPCPHCNHFQTLKWNNVKWEKDDPSTAAYACEHCGILIEEHYKTKMLMQGEWRAHNPESKVIGFHLNSLYSPVGWYSWGEAAKDFLDSKGDQEKLRTFVNTVLGETWKEKGDAPEWKKLYLRRESYEIGTVPDAVSFLTMGCDIQKNRIECEIVGWGQNKESWSIDYRILEGRTEEPEVWNELAQLIESTFPTAGGKQLGIRLTAIDSGYNTQQVYDFCRRYPSNRVIPVKGSDTQAVAISLPKAVDIRATGKTIKRGVRVWTVGVTILKSELYSFLNQDPVLENDIIPPGYCHFPEYGEEYFKQITAEEIRHKKNTKGYRVTEWVKIRERNEALDCRIYARAAATVCGIDRMKNSQHETAKLNGQKSSVAKPIKNNENKNNEKMPRPKMKRKKSSSSIW